MSTGYKIAEGTGASYLTFQIVAWVDIFTRKVYRDIVIESLKYCQQNKDFELYAYVIMSNHIHLLARSQSGDLSGRYIRLRQSLSRTPFRLFVTALVGVYSLGLTENRYKDGVQHTKRSKNKSNGKSTS